MVDQPSRTSFFGSLDCVSFRTFGRSVPVTAKGMGGIEVQLAFQLARKSEADSSRKESVHAFAGLSPLTTEVAAADATARHLESGKFHGRGGRGRFIRQYRLTLGSVGPVRPPGDSTTVEAS